MILDVISAVLVFVVLLVVIVGLASPRRGLTTSPRAATARPPGRPVARTGPPTRHPGRGMFAETPPPRPRHAAGPRHRGRR